MASDRFTITDVATINGLQPIEKRGGNEKFYVCPFCGNKKGKFSINDSKNSYHCWSCDAGGNALSLHANLNPKPEYSDAMGKKRICKDIYAALGEGYVGHHEANYKPVEDQSALKKQDGEISKVYKEMLNLLSLKEEHKQDLIRRGMSEEIIKALKFKSIEKGMGKKIARQLLNKGLSLEGVPGFFMDQYKNWNLKIPVSGYLCPVYDGDYSYILGFQINNDNHKINPDDSKYVWLSSSNLWDGCTKGCSSGSIATCLPAARSENSNNVLIVEGTLKAAVTWALLDRRVTVIGVPGTNAIKGLTPYMERYNDRFFFETFDMDKYIADDKRKYEKYLALTKEELKETGLSEEERKYVTTTKRISEAKDDLISFMDKYRVPSHSLTWNTTKDGYWKGEFKGIDDFLLEYPDRDKFVGYLNKISSEKLRMIRFFGGK